MEEVQIESPLQVAHGVCINPIAMSSASGGGLGGGGADNDTAAISFSWRVLR